VKPARTFGHSLLRDLLVIAHLEPWGGGGQVQVLWFFFFFFCPVGVPF